MASPTPAGARGAASLALRSPGVPLPPHPATSTTTSSHVSTRQPGKYAARDPICSIPTAAKAPASILKAAHGAPAGASAAADAAPPRPRGRERRVQFAPELCSYSQERQAEAEADAASRLAGQETPAAKDRPVTPGGDALLEGETVAAAGTVQEAAKGSDETSVVMAAPTAAAAAPPLQGASTSSTAAAVAGTPAEAAAPAPAPAKPTAAAPPPPAASAPAATPSAAAVPAPASEAARKAASAPTPSPTAAVAAPISPAEAPAPSPGLTQSSQHPRSIREPPTPLAAHVARTAPHRDSAAAAAAEKQPLAAQSPLSKTPLPVGAGPTKRAPQGRQAQRLLNHSSSPPMSSAGVSVPISPLMPPPGTISMGAPFSPLVPPPWLPPPSPKPPGPGSNLAPKPSKLPVRTAQAGASQGQQGPSLPPKTPLGAPPRAGTAAGAADVKPSHTAGAHASTASAAPAPSPASKPATVTVTGPAPAPSTPIHAPAPTPGAPTNTAPPSRAPSPAPGMRHVSAPPPGTGQPPTSLPQSAALSPTPGRTSHPGPRGAAPPLGLLSPELQARLQVLCSDASLLAEWESAFSELGYTKSEPSTAVQGPKQPTDVPMGRTTSLTTSQPGWARKLVVGPSSPSPASTPRLGASPFSGSHMRSAPTLSQPGTPNARAPHAGPQFRASPLLVGPQGLGRNEQLGTRSPATPRGNSNTAQSYVSPAPMLGADPMAAPKHADANRPSSADGARPSAQAAAAVAAAAFAAPRSVTQQPSRPMAAGPGMGSGRGLAPAGLLGSRLVVGPGARGAAGPTHAPPSTPKQGPLAAQQGGRLGGSVPSSPLPGPIAQEIGRRPPASPLSRSAQQPKGNLQVPVPVPVPVPGPVPGPGHGPRWEPAATPGSGSAPSLPTHAKPVGAVGARPVGAAGPQRRLEVIPEANHPQVLPPLRPHAVPSSGAGKPVSQAPGMGMRPHAHSGPGQNHVPPTPVPAAGRPATADSARAYSSRGGPQQVPGQRRTGTPDPPKVGHTDGRRQMMPRAFSSMPYALPALFGNKPTSSPGKTSLSPLSTAAQVHQVPEPSTPLPTAALTGVITSAPSVSGAPAPVQQGATASGAPAAGNEGAHEVPRLASPLGLRFPGTIRVRATPPSPARKGLTTPRAEASPRTSFLRSLLHGQLRMAYSPTGPSTVTSPGGSGAESEAQTPPPQPGTPAHVDASTQAPRPSSADPASLAHPGVSTQVGQGQRFKGSPGGGRRGLWLWPASPLLGRKAPTVEAVCTPRIGQLAEGHAPGWTTVTPNGYKGSASPRSVLSEQLSEGSRPWSPFLGTDVSSTSSRTSSVASPNPSLRYSSAATSASISATAVKDKNHSFYVSQTAVPGGETVASAATHGTQHAGPAVGKESGAAQAALVLQPKAAGPVPYQPVVDVGRYSWPEEGLAC